ncbi:MAG: EamA family transporter [Vicinamibacterales bacterium]
MSNRTSTVRAYVAWAAVCVLWGTTYLAIRIALETVPPLLMGALRWPLAGAAILTMLRLRGQRLPPPRDWGSLAIVGVLLIGVGNGGVVWAERTLPSGLTALLVAAIPFWMVGVERLAGDRSAMAPARVFGLFVGFSGIVLLVWPELEIGRGGRDTAIGVVATQVACLGWAIGSSYSRRRGASENVLAAAAFQMLFGGLAMLAAGAARGELPYLALNARTAGAIVYLLVFGSVIGFSAYAFALKHLPVATVSLYAYVNPVIAVALGTIVLGEPLSPRLAVAGAVVLLGVVLVRR